MFTDLPVMLLNDDAKMPERCEDSVGYDMFAFGDHIIPPGQTKIIPAGFAAALEEGYGAFFWDRSGMGAKGIHTFHESYQLTQEMEVLPFSGVIDDGYRGQWGVVLHNFSSENFVIKHQQKIAQFVIHECARPIPRRVTSLPPSKRGARGFGSTDQGKTEQQTQELVGGTTLVQKVGIEVVRAPVAPSSLQPEVKKEDVQLKPPTVK